MESEIERKIHYYENEYQIRIISAKFLGDYTKNISMHSNLNITLVFEHTAHTRSNVLSKFRKSFYYDKNTRVALYFQNTDNFLKELDNNEITCWEFLMSDDIIIYSPYYNLKEPIKFYEETPSVDNQSIKKQYQKLVSVFYHKINYTAENKAIVNQKFIDYTLRYIYFTLFEELPPLNFNNLLAKLAVFLDMRTYEFIRENTRYTKQNENFMPSPKIIEGLLRLKNDCEPY